MECVCGASFPKRFKQRHRDKECGKEIVSCEYCHTDIFREDKKVRLSLEFHGEISSVIAIRFNCKRQPSYDPIRNALRSSCMSPYDPIAHFRLLSNCMSGYDSITCQITIPLNALRSKLRSKLRSNQMLYDRSNSMSSYDSIACHVTIQI